MEITIDGIEYNLVEKSKVKKKILKEVVFPEVEFVVSDKEMTWEEANKWCKNLNGRLPTVGELQAYRYQIEEYIGSQADNYFWSASTPFRNNTNAWYVNLGYGSTYSNLKTASYHVVCLRG